MNCGPYLITTTPSKVAYMHCTRIQQGQAGVSAITRRPKAFIVAHELGWASTRSRPGPPFCSIRNSSIVKSLQRGIQSSASGCNNFALIADMKLNLKRTPSTRMRMVVVVVALMNLIALTYPYIWCPFLYQLYDLSFYMKQVN